MFASYIQTLSVSDPDALYVGWPVVGPNTFTFPSGRASPLWRPTQNQRVLRVFIGSNITQEMQENLQLELASRFHEGQTTYQGVVFTVSQQAWVSGEHARAVFNFFEQSARLLEYSLIQVIDSQRNIELHCGLNVVQGSRTSSSYIYAPIDAFGEQDMVAKMLGFPFLVELEVASPSHPFNSSDQLKRIVQGIIQVLQKAQKSLRKCSLWLDLTTRDLPNLFETLFQISSLSELVLVSPVDHDLLKLKTIEPTTQIAFEQSILSLQGIRALTLPISLITPGIIQKLSQLPNLERLSVDRDLLELMTIEPTILIAFERSILSLQGIRTLTLPISLITPDIIQKLSQLPNLERLTVSPTAGTDSVLHLNRCLVDGGVLVQGILIQGDSESEGPVPFRRLQSLNLGDLGPLDQRVFDLRMILWNVVLDGDPRSQNDWLMNPFPDIAT